MTETLLHLVPFLTDFSSIKNWNRFSIDWKNSISASLHVHGLKGLVTYLIEDFRHIGALQSTCPLVLGCWELRYVNFLMLKKKELLAKLSKFTKWQLFSLKMVLGCRFWVNILWIYSALQALISFSAWEKLRKKLPGFSS